PGGHPGLATSSRRRLHQAAEDDDQREQDQDDDEDRQEGDDLAPVGRDELGHQLQDVGPDPLEHRWGSGVADGGPRHSSVDPATRTYAMIAIATPRKMSIVVPEAISYVTTRP